MLNFLYSIGFLTLTPFNPEGLQDIAHADILEQAMKVKNKIDAENYLGLYENRMKQYDSSNQRTAMIIPDDCRKLCKDMILNYASESDNYKIHRLFYSIK